jgi:hypothetical protein
MSQERYFLYLHGTQRGPYTVSQIGHMVNSGIVHSEAMFWCEGLEQWQPVTQLIVPKEEVKRRRIHLGAGTLGTLGGIVLVLWLFMPTLREGWREQHQVEKDQFAAYWRARGVLRESLGWFSGAHFREFEPAKVTLLDGERASVELEAQISPVFGDARVTRWKVDLKYDTRLRMWMADDPKPPPSE